jgi:hypothetical protein
MRPKKNADPLGHGRLLDAWVPPAKAGEALGCFATTFTFQSKFFETECLGRMLQLECDPDTGGASYLIEREEKMARLMSACVVVDRTHARGQRSLRWDLVPFRTKTGILHAKLSILLWQNCARVIVASANLTEHGYRQNLEVFTVWDFHAEGVVPPELFSAAADFADDVLNHCREKVPGGSPALERSRDFIVEARRRVREWLPDSGTTPKLKTTLVPLTPKSTSVFEQLKELWPRGSPADTLSILSPFFDQGPVNKPAKAAWDLLRQREKGAEILFSVVAEPVQVSGKLMVHAPATLVESLPDKEREARILFKQIKMPVGRALHAKSLWIENRDYFLHCIGSSNFTSAGLGIGGVRNWELNVASWARVDNRDEFRARSAAWPELEKQRIDTENVCWSPAPDIEDQADLLAPLLPDWCGSAIYLMKEGGQATLELSMAETPPVGWAILDETGTRTLLTPEAWVAGSAKGQIQIPWPDARPPTELLVRIPGQPGECRWPVEVRAFSDLPPPQELRDLSLEQLMAILTSALPLHRILQKLLRLNSDEPAPAEPATVLDALKRFAHEKEKHLLERTRRFSLAMAGMRRRLEAPIPSEEYLQWRLFGPVGVTKVAAAILKEAGADGEKAFLLGELALELSQVQPVSDPACVAPSRVRKAIGDIVADFEQQAAPLLKGTEDGLKKYVGSALRKARS